MSEKSFLFLVSDPMSDYTMSDISSMPNVKIISKCKNHVFNNKLIDVIFRTYMSRSLNNRIKLPFLGICYYALFNKYFLPKKPDYIVMTAPWYHDRLIKYFRRNSNKCKILFKSGDTMELCLKNNRRLTIDKIKEQFDQVFVYNPIDAEKYGFLLYPVCYSSIDISQLEQYEHCDVAFIGAAKQRLSEIRRIYCKLSEEGLACYFYVTDVPANERLDDGIIYADKSLTFMEYIAREIAADCLLEIIQKGTIGRTFRMMEAIIYNKKLITNCPEILSQPYYDIEFVHYFEKIEDIEPAFVKRPPEKVNYKYTGDFSPLRLLEFIERGVSN